MPSSQDELLARFHRTLVEEIRERRPESLREGLTVAEIYQDLVPYRTHRDRIGVAMNGDYEATLLRLLAGEGGYLLLDSGAAREEIAAELESPNPDTSLFRQFAALDVHLNPERIESGERAAEPEEDAEEDAEAPGSPVPSRVTARGPVPPDPTPLPGPDPVPTPDRDPTPLPHPEPTPVPSPEPTPTPPPEPTPPPPGPGPEPPEPEPEPPPPPRGTRSAPVCRWCRGELPRHRRTLRHCPHCGSGIQLRTCPGCGEELEVTWRFCIACGTEIES